jgi:glyoxylate reductase
MTVIAIARVLLPAGLELLQDRGEVRVGGSEVTPERVREIVAGADVLIADPTVIVDDPLLDAAGPGLRLVANYAVGYDNIDLEACRRRGVLVTNTPDVLTNATAELALALTLSAARLLGDAERDLRAGVWRGWDPALYRGLELSGATFGVVGMGRIGSRYAELLSGLRPQLLFTSRSPREETEGRLEAARVGLEDLLRRCDVVSLHVPATPQTHHLIDAGALELMKPDAVLVNTARGSLVDLPALAAALREGRIGAAGLDVFEDEPDVPPEILDAPRVVLTPHIGSATVKARDAMASTVAANVLAALDGREPPNRIA